MSSTLPQQPIVLTTILRIPLSTTLSDPETMAPSDTFLPERLDQLERSAQWTTVSLDGSEERRSREEHFEAYTDGIFGSLIPCFTTQQFFKEMNEWSRLRYNENYKSFGISWWDTSGAADEWMDMKMDQWDDRRAAPLEADWISKKDDAFAFRFLNRIHQSESNSQVSTSPKLCKTCTSLPRPLKLSTILSGLSTPAKACKVCGFLYQHFKGPGTPEENTTEAIAYGSGLDVARFELFREWLRTCDDEQHPCRPKPDLLPTMVIDLGGDEYSDSVRLVRPDGKVERYVALSHRWSTHGNFCTYRCNVDGRQRGINVNSLPRKFKDAITVTRQLGIRFLWVDSVCIIQRHEGCGECGEYSDWGVERDKMEQYFGSAYLTIAATSSSSSNGLVDEGFLGRQSYARWVDGQTRTSPGSGSVAIDDFQRDVNEADLNRRGWVLQERALSHRTIHFTATQAYWECGHGIRCETLTNMQNQTTQFLSDPEFPKLVLGHFERNKIRLFSWLFREYSNFGLTVPTDRSVAISGLVHRLADTFKTPCRYGIYKKYLHRCLLWQRSGERLKRISYPADRRVPSWSWMAYDGRISYLDVDWEKVEWNTAVDVPFGAPGSDEDVLNAPAREISLHDADEEGDAEKEKAAQRRRLILDEDDMTNMIADNIQTLRFVVMGRQTDGDDVQEEHYVLFIKPSRNGTFQDYERVGVGVLIRGDSALESQPVQVRVV